MQSSADVPAEEAPSFLRVGLRMLAWIDCPSRVIDGHTPGRCTLHG
jgi:hypothetical protein